MIRETLVNGEPVLNVDTVVADGRALRHGVPIASTSLGMSMFRPNLNFGAWSRPAAHLVRRRHSSLGYLSPINYERRMLRQGNASCRRFHPSVASCGSDHRTLFEAPPVFLDTD